MPSRELFSIPIVTRDINDSVEYAGNVYEKAGWVLHMLREQLGDDAFFRALKHYLEANRLQNVVTADLVKAIEESTGTNVDRFFDQWIYGAGAPRFTVRSTYDAAAKKVSLDVKQTQKVEGRVGLFRVPIEVAVTTASGEKLFPIEVSKAEETFSFSVDGPPLMVLFDKGDKILKSLDFQKTPEEWIRQLQTAADVPDRADAARRARQHQGQRSGDQPRSEKPREKTGSGAFGKKRYARSDALILRRRANRFWLRSRTNNPGCARLPSSKWAISRMTRRPSSACRKSTKTIKPIPCAARRCKSLAQDKAPGAADLLEKALSTSSPDDVLRRASLRAMGALGDDCRCPGAARMVSPGKAFALRGIAIGALGRVDLKNHDITARLISYLNEPSFDIRFASIFALGRRGDPTAIEPLEALLKTGQLSMGVPHAVEGLIDN